VRRRAYRDIGYRLRRLPARLWCAYWHRRLWKVVRFVGVSQGRAWVQYRCRVCGRQFTWPLGEGGRA
jgi:hypothetical protein